MKGSWTQFDKAYSKLATTVLYSNTVVVILRVHPLVMGNSGRTILIRETVIQFWSS